MDLKFEIETPGGPEVRSSKAPISKRFEKNRSQQIDSSEEDKDEEKCSEIRVKRSRPFPMNDEENTIEASSDIDDNQNAIVLKHHDSSSSVEPEQNTFFKKRTLITTYSTSSIDQETPIMTTKEIYEEHAFVMNVLSP